jgi:hypothetical protein
MLIPYVQIQNRIAGYDMRAVGQTYVSVCLSALNAK